jgi:hypothetical protein
MKRPTFTIRSLLILTADFIQDKKPGLSLGFGSQIGAAKF